MTKPPPDVVHRAGASLKMSLLTFLACALPDSKAFATNENGPAVDMIKDINTRPSRGSELSEFYEFIGRLFFSAYSADEDLQHPMGVKRGYHEEEELYVTNNGSVDSYYRVLNGAFDYAGFTEFDERLFFAATSADWDVGRELYVTDGTNDGTYLVANINGATTKLDSLRASSDPRQFTVFNDTLYFIANGYGNYGAEGLYAINVMSDRTRHVQHGVFSIISMLNSKLLLSAEDGIWVSDGTSVGASRLLKTELTEVLSHTKYGDNISLALGSRYSYQYPEIWVTDGTMDGTERLGSGPGGFKAYNGKLYFAGADDAHGEELWVTDATPAGTMLLKDINPGTPWSEPGSPDFVESNGRLFFAATDKTHGKELWITDGTSTGTRLVKDINPTSHANGNAKGSYPSLLMEYNGMLVFVADDGENGKEMWMSDGSEKGTQLVKDINPGSNSSNPTGLKVLNGKLLFTADDGKHGQELWSLVLPPTEKNGPKDELEPSENPEYEINDSSASRCSYWIATLLIIQSLIAANNLLGLLV